MPIYPKLNSLKQKLATKPITNYRGIEFGTDEDALHAMGTIDGKVVFKSGLEMTFKQYRGQVKEYPTCNANLYRTQDYEKIFLSVCRTIAFENLLDNHPYMKLLKQVKYDDGDIYINNTAIAQHYELQTPYLDLTSNFDVASFFATCILDPYTGKYKPYLGTENVGVIYVYNEMMHFAFEDMNFEYIGWQGLPRPEEQKGSIYHLKYNEDFANVSGVRKHYFKHSPSTSKKIWNQFDQGKLLFPDDVAADLANECKKLTTFTENEILQAKNRFIQWTKIKYKDADFDTILDKLNILIVKDSLLKWNSLMDIQESHWIDKVNTVFQKTKTRMSAYL